MPSRSYARTSVALGLAALALEALPTACGGVYPRHGADGAGSYDHPDYPLVMVEVEVGGEISFGLPDALHSGPAHSEDLCIHPSPDAQQPEATTYSSEPYRIPALHTVVFTDAVATPMPTQCVVHQEDALAACSKLEGCAAMTCLPNDNYRHLFPPQNKMPDGSLVGDDLALLQAAQGHGTREAFARLVESGAANLDAVDRERERSALIYASIRGDVEQVRLLLEAGGDPLIADTAGYTALDHVRESLRQGNEANPRWSTGNGELYDSHSRDIAELLRKRIDDLRVEAARVPEIELVDGHVEGLIKGPVCFARAHTDVNEPRSERCSAHATDPAARCHNLKMTPQPIAEVLDMATLTAKASRRLAPGVAGGRTLLALPATELRSGATPLWFKWWDLHERDVVGEAKTKGGAEVLLAFVP